ncbi:MAG: DHH family phosphoesterase [Lachnospiraceae bacterium]|nr:DHH family phosphoesterase [Lachnospiraceae bacterium]
MRLSDLKKYDKITLQCHDNPDADALASAYGLYLYFRDQGKDVRIIYGGRNEIQKSNLKLMLKEFSIPVTYIDDKRMHIDGLLITVDCQEGESNVTPFEYDSLAIIDHHQSSPSPLAAMDMTEIRSELGSCSTLVWQLLGYEGFNVNMNSKLATALYYGLMTDTSNFAEMKHPLDRDMQDSLAYDQSVISLLVNSNISLRELEIAGVALIRYVYNPDRRYAIIHSQPCDPNILGLIADFLLQVDVIDICVVFNEESGGYKFSVRSCVKEVHADELIEFLTADIGNGGGHIDKAGGFIAKNRMESVYKELDIDAYIGNAMNRYFASSEVIYAGRYKIDPSEFKKYVKKPIIIGMVDPSEFWPKDTLITVRTLEGDINTVIDENTYIMVGIVGEVYPIRKEKFDSTYMIVDEPYECDVSYTPTIRNRITGEMKELRDYIRPCRSTQTNYILAKELDKTVKVFTSWDNQNYMLGRQHDYMAARIDDNDDIYIIEGKIFAKTYEEA